MAFWQVILIFSAVGALFVLWPLIKISFTGKSIDLSGDNDQTQVELYNEHLKDLERSHSDGDIDESQFSDLKLELQKTLISEGVVKRGEFINRGGKKIVLACGLVVPVLSFILYQNWGAEKDWDIHQTLERLGEVKSHSEYNNTMRDLVVSVQQRLKSRPDDLQLKNLLGQTSMALQDYDKAVQAYESILLEFPESPRVIANLAQALFYREGNVVTEKVREYTHKALALAPMLPEMLGLAGIDAKNRGDYKAAIEYWKSAARFMDPSSSTAKGYLSGIANAEKALLAAKGSSGTEKADAPVAAEAETASEVQSISVNVKLLDGIDLAGTETLYVYARAWKGAKVPLAIKKLSVSSLPLSIVLDETMAMAPGMTITTFPQLEVIARISLDGGPIAKSGDWQASFGPVVLSDLKKAVELVISKQLP